MRCLRLSDTAGLTLDLGSWGGPLDLLLALARAQKVDLREISMLTLVDQYLDYLNRADAIALEQAADYLVMAAWLAYLKSCLLMPEAEKQLANPEEMAFRLQQRLRRLDAMREAGARLMARDRIGRDIFIRGHAEGLTTNRKTRWQVNLFDLIAAYGQVNARTTPVLHQVSRRPVLTLEAAMQRIEAMLGKIVDWTPIAVFLPQSDNSDFRRSALASTVVATLEIARRGLVAVRQDEAFGPIEVKAA